jgi:hypothetical protein
MNPRNFPLNKERKQKEAAARQEASDKLTPEQRIAKLDELFGPGLGARKERLKLDLKLKKAADKAGALVPGDTTVVAGPTKVYASKAQQRREEAGRKAKKERFQEKTNGN